MNVPFQSGLHHRVYRNKFSTHYILSLFEPIFAYNSNQLAGFVHNFFSVLQKEKRNEKKKIIEA